MNTRTKYFYILFLLATGLIVSSCYSVPKDIPANLSADELILLAQTSYDEGNTKAAQAYYETIIIRYGDNKSLLVEAEYEIAHMKVKKKKWSQAIPDLQRILSYYDEEDGLNLPQEYKKLAQIDFAKIPEHELRRAGVTLQETNVTPTF